MSNTGVYLMRLGGGLSSSKTNEMKQFRGRSGRVTSDFPASTDIIFNSRITSLSQFNLAEVGRTNMQPHKTKVPGPASALPQATNTLNPTKSLKAR